MIKLLAFLCATPLVADPAVVASSVSEPIAFRSAALVTLFENGLDQKAITAVESYSAADKCIALYQASAAVHLSEFAADALLILLVDNHCFVKSKHSYTGILGRASSKTFKESQMHLRNEYLADVLDFRVRVGLLRLATHQAASTEFSRFFSDLRRTSSPVLLELGATAAMYDANEAALSCQTVLDATKGMTRYSLINEIYHRAGCLILE